MTLLSLNSPCRRESLLSSPPQRIAPLQDPLVRPISRYRVQHIAIGYAVFGFELVIAANNGNPRPVGRPGSQPGPDVGNHTHIHHVDDVALPSTGGRQERFAVWRPR